MYKVPYFPPGGAGGAGGGVIKSAWEECQGKGEAISSSLYNIRAVGKNIKREEGKGARTFWGIKNK